MIIGCICFIVFLFTVYQLSKDDFSFIRKGVALDSVFNAIFLGLPVVLLSSRLLYALLHPSVRYLNPLVFFIVPYFPGLSLVGGIVGAWIFLILYTRKKKIPTLRFLDVISISFLLALSIGILLQGMVTLLRSRITGIEEIGRSMIGVAFFIFTTTQFLKSKWIEGSIAYFVLCAYCVLELLSIGFALLSHASFSVISLGIMTVFLLIAAALFAYQQKLFQRVRPLQRR